MKVKELPKIYDELREMGYPYIMVCIPMTRHLDCKFEDGPIIHVVGYPALPTVEDREALVQELATDPEFQMTDWVYNKDYFIEVMADEIYR